MSSPNAVVTNPAIETYLSSTQGSKETLPVPQNQVVELALAVIKENGFLTLGVGYTAGGVFFHNNAVTYSVDYTFLDKIKALAAQQGIIVGHKDKYTDYVLVGEGPQVCKIFLYKGKFDDGIFFKETY